MDAASSVPQSSVAALRARGRPARVSHEVFSHGPSPGLLAYALLPVAYYAAAQIGVAWTVRPEQIAILWPPNGVLLAFLIHFRGRGLAGFAGLAILAEVAADVPAFSVGQALMFGTINVLEATLAAALLRRWAFDPRFSTTSDLVKFVVAAPVMAAFSAAIFGALVYDTFRGDATGYFEFLRIWWFGDAVGLLIVTPLLLSWCCRPRDYEGAWGVGHASDWLIGPIGLGAVLVVLLSSGGGVLGVSAGPVLLLPLVMFVAARFPLRISAAVLAAAALVVLWLTTAGQAPFGAVTGRDAVLRAQELIVVLSLSALGFSATLAELRDSRARAEATHAALQARAAEVVALNEGLERRVAERTRELQGALSQVKRLQGLLPMCAWCKNVRDDEDYWHSVEDYISQRSEAQFSHGICPTCARQHFSDASDGSM